MNQMNSQMMSQMIPPLNFEQLNMNLLNMHQPSINSINGVQCNLIHMTEKPNNQPKLQTIIDISIKMHLCDEINIKITEDPDQQGNNELNFYDIQYQIETQLNNHKKYFTQ